MRNTLVKAAAHPGWAGLVAAGSGKIYRSDHYDMWHNVAKRQERVN
jgi:hypothetical protein